MLEKAQMASARIIMPYQMDLCMALCFPQISGDRRQAKSCLYRRRAPYCSTTPDRLITRARPIYCDGHHKLWFVCCARNAQSSPASCPANCEGASSKHCIYHGEQCDFLPFGSSGIVDSLSRTMTSEGLATFTI